MSLYSIELLVRLKTADTVALTARNTLQRDLGYEGVLIELEREDCWLIDTEAESQEEAESFGIELATVTKIFVNPNKHTYRLRAFPHGARKELSMLPEALNPPYLLKLLVGYRQDEKAKLALETLRRTLGYAERIVNLERSTLWSLKLDAESYDEARRIAEEIAVSKSIDKGLLVNPHSQTYSLG